MNDRWQIIDVGFRFRLPRDWTKVEVRGVDSHVGEYRGPSASLEFDEIFGLGYTLEKSAAFIRRLKQKEADPSLRGAGEEIWWVDGRIARVTFESVTPQIYGKREFPLVATMSVAYPGEPAGIGVSIFYSTIADLPTVRKILRSFEWSKRPNKAPEPTPTSVTPRACARVVPAVVVAHL